MCMGCGTHAFLPLCVFPCEGLLMVSACIQWSIWESSSAVPVPFSACVLSSPAHFFVHDSVCVREDGGEGKFNTGEAPG